MLGHTRIRSFGFVAGLAMAMLLPSAAAAATPITFDLQIGFFCIEGNATASVRVALTWKTSDGSVKAKTTVQSGSDGRWQLCNEQTFTPTVAIGDSIKVNDGHSTRTFVVPALTVIQNRSTDRYHGEGPAKQYIVVHCANNLGEFEPCVAKWKIRVDSRGRWSSGTHNHDVIGNDRIYVSWKDSVGDKLWAASTAPTVHVTVGKALVTGTVNGRSAHVEVRDGSTDAVLGSVDAARASDGTFSGKLRHDGHAVPVQVGDRIVSDVANDADFVVFPIDAAADLATDDISGHCDVDASRGVVLASVYRNGSVSDDGDATLADDGSFDIDYLNFESTDKVLVSCQALTGDFVQIWATVH
jgi:hypothetical protein